MRTHPDIGLTATLLQLNYFQISNILHIFTCAGCNLLVTRDRFYSAREKSLGRTSLLLC
jgi:hypothetical protein